MSQPVPAPIARLSPGQRGASMRHFERLHARAMMVSATGLAIAMIVVMFMTVHLR